MEENAKKKKKKEKKKGGWKIGTVGVNILIGCSHMLLARASGVHALVILSM